MNIMPIISNRYNNNLSFGNAKQVQKNNAKNLAVPLIGLSVLAITSCENIKNDGDVFETGKPKIEQTKEDKSNNVLLGLLGTATVLITGSGIYILDKQRKEHKKAMSEIRQRNRDLYFEIRKIEKENAIKQEKLLIDLAGPKPSFESDLKSQLDWIQLRYKKDAVARVYQYRELIEKLREQDRRAEANEVDDILDVLECNLGGTRGG